MGVILDTGSRFPAVTWVDADQRDGTATLIFRHAGRGPSAVLKVTLTRSQREKLKFLVDGPQAAAC